MTTAIADASASSVLAWEAVEAQVARDDQGKWDRLIPRDELRFEAGRLSFPRRYAQGGVGPSNLSLTTWSTTQFCQRLGIPASYFRRCPAPLQDAQANHWLRHAEEEDENDGSGGHRTRVRRSHGSNAGTRESRWLLRAKNDTLRGLLTERYARVGNADLLHVLGPALKECRYSVRWFALTEESLHLRFVDPQRTQEVLPNDPVIVGLHLANSEVGKRCITVDTLVWRLVCANGLVRLVKGKNLFAQRHVALTAAQLSATLPEVIRKAIAEGEAAVERMRCATTLPVSDPRGVIATIASDWGVSQEVEERIVVSLGAEIADQQETLYGLVNAVTNVAQALGPDERYALESLAGTLLEAGPPAVPRDSRQIASADSDASAPAATAVMTASIAAATSQNSSQPALSLFSM